MTQIKNSVTSTTSDSTFRARVYRSESTREVRSRAEFIQHAESREERAGIDRLNRLRGLQTEFNQNAPRGFYLNIKV